VKKRSRERKRVEKERTRVRGKEKRRIYSCANSASEQKGRVVMGGVDIMSVKTANCGAELRQIGNISEK